jgi:nucleotide-binding universal stress UspA family protein
LADIPSSGIACLLIARPPLSDLTKIKVPKCCACCAVLDTRWRMEGIGIMFKHILVATDGSELANKALTKGLELGQVLAAKVTVLTVTSPFPMPSYGNIPSGPLIEAYEKAVTENSERILAQAKDAADKLGIACERLHVTNENTVEGILNTAKSQSCDLVVMASHGYRGVKRLLLGSVATKVLTLSELPVLIFR